MQQRPAPAPHKRLSGNKYLIAIAVMISALTAILDSTIVNVSVPNIQASFGVDVDQVTWILTGYLISNVVIIPMTGWLSYRIGLKRYYMLSQVIFMSASMLCGLAWNFESLVFFRILQGIGGGALLPVSLSIMLEAFPPEETAQATAIFGMGAVVGPIIGPALGGWLTENLSWRWIFFVNLPIVIAGLVACWLFIKTPKREETEVKPIDVWGFAFVTIWLGTLQIVLQEGQRNNWFESGFITVTALVSVIFMFVFLWWELRIEHPFINLRIFKDRNFTIGSVLGGVIGAALFGSVFLVPIYSAAVLGYNALDIGLMLFPGALVALPVFPIVARLSSLVDSRILCAIGFSTIALSNWLLSFVSDQTAFWPLVGMQAVRSFALPFIFVPISTIGLQNLPPHQKPDGSSLSNLVRTLCGSIAIAALGQFYVSRLRFHFERLGENVTQWSHTTATRLAELQAGFIARGGSDPVTAHQQALGVMQLFITKQAAILGFDDAFRVLAIFTALSVLTVLFVKMPKAPSAAPVHVSME